MSDPCPTCGRDDRASMTDEQVREDDRRIAGDLEALAYYLRTRRHDAGARERALLRARTILRGLVLSGLL